jgi:hypothetical protein
MVGDHRLEVEIIMPDMTNMLHPEKRNLLGHRISQSLMRLPNFDFGRVEGGGTPQAEIASQVLMSDRRIIKRLIERDIYDEVVARNGSSFAKGAPKMYFPRIMFAGTHYFTDYILKLRDRGDISRSTAIEAADFDPESEMVQRQKEIAAGFDKIMTAQNVPSGNAGPGNTGRPTAANGGGTGSSTNDPLANPKGQGAPPATPPPGG